MGNHESNLGQHQEMQAMKFSWLAQGTATIIAPFARVSVIAFIFEFQRRIPWFPKGRIFLIVIGVSNVMLGICEGTITLLGCWPTVKLWDRSVPGSCHLSDWNPTLCLFVQSYYSFTDLILTIYPTTMILQTKMRSWTKVKKIRVTCLMGLSIFPTVCAALKAYYLQKVGSPVDKPHNYAPYLIWTMTEIWVILIMVCIPQLYGPTRDAIRPVLTKILMIHRLNQRPGPLQPHGNGVGASASPPQAQNNTATHAAVSDSRSTSKPVRSALAH